MRDRTPRKRVPPGAVSTVGLLVAVLLVACSGPKEGTFTIVAPPENTFAPVVSDALEVHCGTLDCHGSVYRNLRFFGHFGTRASPDEKTGIEPTSDEEYVRNYDSLIAIEPEALSTIMQKHGAGFDSWIVVTKGTNAEVHKGGQQMKKGDTTYTCLSSWILGAVQMDACLQSVNLAELTPGAMTPGGMTPGGTTPGGTTP